MIRLNLNQKAKQQTDGFRQEPKFPTVTVTVLWR